MAGCFGNSKEDRAMSNELSAYENKQAEEEMREERIKAMADDIYKEKLASLPNLRKGTHFDYTNIGDVLSELDKSENREAMIDLALFVRDEEYSNAGYVLVELVKKQLQYEAQYEAENECE